jgi:hypothetical protein
MSYGLRVIGADTAPHTRRAGSALCVLVDRVYNSTNQALGLRTVRCQFQPCAIKDTLLVGAVCLLFCACRW